MDTKTLDISLPNNGEKSKEFVRLHYSKLSLYSDILQTVTTVGTFSTILQVDGYFSIKVSHSVLLIERE